MQPSNRATKICSNNENGFIYNAHNKLELNQSLNHLT